MLYCPNCGKKIKSNSRFCPYCGADLTNVHTKPNSNNVHFKNKKHKSISYIIIAIIIAFCAVGGGKKIYQNHEHTVYMNNHPKHQLPPSIVDRHYSFKDGSKLYMHRKNFVYVGGTNTDGSEDTDDNDDTPGASYYYHVQDVSYGPSTASIRCKITATKGIKKYGHTGYQGLQITIKGHQITNRQLDDDDTIS